MRIWTLSDCHQEFLRDPEAAKNPSTRFHLGEHVPADADVCVIAGDLDVTLANSLRRIAAELPGREVVYVAGNHDHYNDGSAPPQTMDEILAEGRSLAADLGIHFLENDSVEIGGVRFLGATMWTDMMSVGRGNLAAKMSEAAGRHGMRDYRRMKRWSTKHDGKRKPATPAMTVSMHAASRAYIERELAMPFLGQTVVVTHHGPHPESLDPRYSGSLDFCYASNLTLLLESEDAPDLWIHGHIHAARDYIVGGTRVVSNPRGYTWDDDVHNGFQPGLLIELGEPRPTSGIWP